MWRWAEGRAAWSCSASLKKRRGGLPRAAWGDCFATTTGMRHETDDSSFWTLRGRDVPIPPRAMVQFKPGKEMKEKVAQVLPIIREQQLRSRRRVLAL